MKLKPLKVSLLVIPVYFSTIFLAFCVGDLMAPPAVVETPPEPPVVIQPEYLTQEEAVAIIAADELKEWLFTIAGDEYEGRGPGQPGYEKAADFVEGKCKEWGLTTERQKFTTGKGDTENVFAYIEGTDPVKKNEIVVIGAHLDHLGKTRRGAIYNGADDNGSGSVALLGIAKAFSEVAPPLRTVVFQWYSAEEMGLVGSRFYCNNPTFPKDGPGIDKHVAMINLDMVGRMTEGRYRTGWHTASGGGDLVDYVTELVDVYPFAKQITSHRTGGSDHASFYNKRVPIAFLHTGTHHDYHRTTDDPDKINYVGLEDIAKFAFELGCNVANADARPEVDQKSFAIMADDHDHGNEPFVKTAEVPKQQSTNCRSCRRFRLRR